MHSIMQQIKIPVFIIKFSITKNMLMYVTNRSSGDTVVIFSGIVLFF